MSDHEINAYCQEKFRQFEEHQRDTPAVRENVTMTCQAVGWLTKRLDAIEGASMSIKVSLFGIVVAILMQIGGFVYLWGQQTKTIERNSSDISELQGMFPRTGGATTVTTTTSLN